MGLLERVNVAIEDARAIILSPGNGWEWVSTTYRNINSGGDEEDEEPHCGPGNCTYHLLCLWLFGQFFNGVHSFETIVTK